ncbi:hypothetical protein TTHERM_00312110 (macronuclear) [Tetrahymena thermophila SB210]|uniref:Uncharacterized protein n=1 Tax=Tetrahymena thermophila (strain SB210) TaxID=312017 RepID=Q22KR9_TETTS|nr:hypothetical protein TTHERM_00312110 [Tetrahymena thermophila SB210]EAR85730.2 hypothetical protein TTHERM_00312110 [Tetrahymena thermophila SB210]|eukprot:XP_001033393.2 hypothetical protein TTHERM_00312110 [Tetrahymena thermophila SB210]
MGCCGSSKQAKSQQERDKVLKEGSQVIVQMQKQIREMLEQNIQYEKQITEMKNQLKQLTVLLDEKQIKLTTQASAMEKYQISDKDEIAEVQREIRELKQQTEFYEQKYSKNEKSLLQVQMQLQNVSQRIGGNQPLGSNQQDDLVFQGDQQQLEQRVYNNERNLQVQEEEFNKKIENVNSQMNKMQTANAINKRDIDNLLEIVQTQQQLIIDEVQKHKQTSTQLTQIEQQLIISKEFQLIQQLQIEKISNMIMEQRNQNQNSSNKNRVVESYGTQLQECIEQQKRRHLNDLNIIHKQQGFQWKDWRELEEYKWVLTQDNKFAHEFEIKQQLSAAAADQQNNSMKQKIVCNICYLQYISMNKFFTQLQLNQLAQNQ